MNNRLTEFRQSTNIMIMGSEVTEFSFLQKITTLQTILQKASVNEHELLPLINKTYMIQKTSQQITEDQFSRYVNTFPEGDIKEYCTNELKTEIEKYRKGLFSEIKKLEDDFVKKLKEIKDIEEGIFDVSGELEGEFQPKEEEKLEEIIEESTEDSALEREEIESSDLAKEERASSPQDNESVKLEDKIEINKSEKKSPISQEEEVSEENEEGEPEIDKEDNSKDEEAGDIDDEPRAPTPEPVTPLSPLVARNREDDEDSSAKRRKTDQGLKEHQYPSEEQLQSNDELDRTSNQDKESSAELKESEGKPEDISQERENKKKEKRQTQLLSSLLQNISSHRYASPFLNPVSNTDAPNYYSMILEPRDLKTLKRMVREGEVSDLDELEKNVWLMFANCLMYNKSGDLVELSKSMMSDVEGIFGLFYDIKKQ